MWGLRILLALPVILTSQLFPSPVHAQQNDDTPGNFFNPPATTNQKLQFDSKFTLGDNATITWTTTLTNYTVAFYQNVPGVRADKGNTAVYSTKNGGPQQFNWKVQTYEFNIQTSPVFFFWLGEGSLADVGVNTPGFTSAYFNITKAAVSSSSSSSSKTTSVTASKTNGPVSQTASGSSSPISTSTGSNSSSLGTGAIVGIVVALVVGLGAGAAAAFFLYRWHSRRKAAEAASAANNDIDDDKAKALNGSGEYYAPVPQHPVEMEGNKTWSHGPVELEPGRSVSELEPGKHISEIDNGQAVPPSELP